MHPYPLMAAAILALAGCAEEAAKAPPVPAAPASLPVGLWKTSGEVSQYKTMDAGTPVIAAKVGDKNTGETCVAAGEGKKPNAIYLKAGDTMKLGIAGLGEQNQQVVEWRNLGDAVFG